jgi:adenylate cyclase
LRAATRASRSVEAAARFLRRRIRRGDVVRRARLSSGLILFAYVLSHLANHAAGLYSLEAMEAGRAWFLAAWRNPVGTVLLYGAFATHFVLALWALYARRRLRMPVGEAVQLVLGFAVPLLLLGHVIGTRLVHELYGTNDTYTYVLLAHWKFNTSYLVEQTLGLVAAWVHGCIGIHYWLRLKPGYIRLVPVLYGAALIVPVLSLLGYAHAGRAVAALAEDPEWLRAAAAAIGYPSRDEAAGLLAATREAEIALAALIALALVARLFRGLIERWRGMVRITYPGDRQAVIAKGVSILEASQAFGIPHASVCGGRGRCSTCRVRVTVGLAALAAPSESEQRVLERIGRPVHVRLACQTRPTQDISVIPLLPPDASPRDGFPKNMRVHGQEREIAILFADLRAFTQFSESRLPYDVVFVLNRYFATMGEAVERAGGHLDKFIGDGVMALFGLDAQFADGCRSALAAARAMAARLDEMNRSLAHELDRPLRIGIGIHAGPAIVGEMGYGPATHLTAIGDSVNIASRLEALTKEFGAQLVVSEAVVAGAGLDAGIFPRHEIEVRGRKEPIAVRVVADALTLAP